MPPLLSGRATNPAADARRESVIHTLTAVTDLLAQGTGPWINFDVGLFLDLFWDNTFDGLTYGAIYALIAMGYTLVYGVLQLINFAHSEVFMLGVFAVYFTLSALGFGPGRRPSVPIVADR